MILQTIDVKKRSRKRKNVKNVKNVVKNFLKSFKNVDKKR